MNLSRAWVTGGGGERVGSDIDGGGLHCFKKGAFFNGRSYIPVPYRFENRYIPVQYRYINRYIPVHPETVYLFIFLFFNGICLSKDIVIQFCTALCFLFSNRMKI